ncbi:MAG: hypothetical protein A2X28_02635 [Elusimicrobia bacterium GWA2_56_46]|nr:MAG: hypothetical protein A2X28_02635 [Elusimicrobia bacterium GWA2_56_46]OGR55342.1 MAG: hypothetical protein A2X39_00330 [Elusimicrobia bacterium GWC2_56_31]HBB67574.1 hypothetical protein [Elusimicrobiota bacterium]HBW23122.1 hypothetical protein [Elusimicrobiota bacterium]
MRLTKLALLLCLSFPLRLWGEDSASLQFTVAAPDPVVAGENVKFQTLTVNTGATQWEKGSYYWVAEVYTIENEEPRFLAQTEPVTPAESVPPGGAGGVQLVFTVPDTFSGRRLLYRVILIKDGRRLLETDFKGFQVIEKKFTPPPPQDFRAGGDVSVTYKNSSTGGWDNHQVITSANIVGKVKRASFLFNTYLVHTYSRPVTPTIVLLNLYAPWGNLSAGDIAPTLTPLSLDGQGMRGVSYERQKNRWAFTGLVGRIVAPQEPTASFSGRFARYTGGGKAVYELRPNLKLSLDYVLSKDDAFSITIDTSANIMKPQQSVVSGASLEWKFLNAFTLNGEYQASAFKADLKSEAQAVRGTGYRQELKYRSGLVGLKAGLSRVDAKFASLASPSVIPDRLTYDAEAGVYPADWLSFSAAYNTYRDNLANDPGKTATTQTQTNLSNTLRLFGGSMLTTSMMTNTALGKPAGVQDNRTNTLNVSLMQPINVHTVNISAQTSDFKDNTRLSHDLSSTLFSLSGSFRVSPRLSLSSGMVNSVTKDKIDASSNKNNSFTGNITYGIPRRAMAVQLWATLSSNKNSSLVTPGDTSVMNLNLETVWLKSRSSKFTFGVGSSAKTDNRNSANNTSEITFLTRLNYSF